MFLQRSLATAMLAGTALAASGCLNVNDSTSDDAAGTDEEGVRNVLFEEMRDYTDPDVRWYETGDDQPSAPVNTVHWRRELLSFERNAVIEFDRPDGQAPTAFVTMTGEAIGLLHLWVGETDEFVRYTKDFTDVGTRSLLLQRVRRHDRPTDRHRGWKLLALSGVEIASPGTTRRLESVRIQGGDVDATITGVTDLVPIEDLLRLPMDVDVTVTVTTGAATDGVFLHLRHRGRRFQLENRGDGTYAGMFHTGGRAGPRHIAVDVLAEGTLWDSEGAYDNVAWGIPLLVGADISPAGGAAVSGPGSVVF